MLYLIIAKLMGSVSDRYVRAGPENQKINFMWPNIYIYDNGNYYYGNQLVTPTVIG